MSVQYDRHKRLMLKHHPELNERWVQARIASDPGLRQGRRATAAAWRPARSAPIRPVGQHPLSCRVATRRDRRVAHHPHDRVLGYRTPPLAAIGPRRGDSRRGDNGQVLQRHQPVQRVHPDHRHPDERDRARRCRDPGLQHGLRPDQLGVEEDEPELLAIQGSAETLAITDNLLKVVQDVDPGIALKYKKRYIGLVHGGDTNIYVVNPPPTQAEARCGRVPDRPIRGSALAPGRCRLRHACLPDAMQPVPDAESARTTSINAATCYENWCRRLKPGTAGCSQAGCSSASRRISADGSV
jgi:hypothetical protein